MSDETHDPTALTKRPSAYYAAVDGLRAAAIMFVMVEHFGGPLAGVFAAGYYGVDLFFVISGYLITGILIRDTNSSFGSAYRTFMGRRVLRIFPVYYLTLLVLWLINFPQARENILYLVSYTWNYRCVSDQGELFYLWSLSVEEQFYLVWPLVALTLRRHLRLLMCVTLSMVLLAYGQLLFNILPSQRVYNYTGLINRMGSLGLGAAGAIAVRRNWIPKILYGSLFIELSVLLAVGWALVSKQPARFPVMSVCSLVLMMKAVRGNFQVPGITKALSNRVVTYVGKVSYGIYIFHWPLGMLFTEYLFDPIWLRIDFSVLGRLSILRWHSWIIKLPLVFLATLFLAHVSHRWFEKPILSLKKRWFPTAIDAKF